MSGFGDRLRREREMRGVSLEEIAESTKIGTRSLRALEEDDFEKLPGGIFNKGFVRAYSRFLGLDEDRTVGDFDTAWKEYEAARHPVQIAEPEEESSSESTSTWLIAALIVAVLLAAGWYLVRRHSQTPPSERVKASPPAIENPQPAATTITNTSTPTSPASASPSFPAPSLAAGSTNKPIQAGISKSASASDSPNVKGSELARTEASQLGESAPIQLQVFAREDSWLSVSADGKSLGQGLLTAQKSRTIRAQKEVRLRLGNVGGVEVSFNGHPVNIDGEPKQVKELTFTPEGLRQ